MCDVMCLSVCTRAYILLGGRVVVVLQKTASFVECICTTIFIYLFIWGRGLEGTSDFVDLDIDLMLVSSHLHLITEYTYQ